MANGLAAFEPADDVTTITICGMGGRLIADILDAGKDKLKGVDRLILQPNNREDDLRIWLMENGFEIIAESIMTENGKYYEIMVAEAGRMSLSDRKCVWSSSHEKTNLRFSSSNGNVKLIN